MSRRPPRSTLLSFLFNDTATTEIYTLSLHDALPISASTRRSARPSCTPRGRSSCSPVRGPGRPASSRDRKSTRLNSSHANISYAVFCLKKQHSRLSLVLRLLLEKTSSALYRTPFLFS